MILYDRLFIQIMKCNTFMIVLKIHCKNTSTEAKINIHFNKLNLIDLAPHLFFIIF